MLTGATVFHDNILRNSTVTISYNCPKPSPGGRGTAAQAVDEGAPVGCGGHRAIPAPRYEGSGRAPRGRGECPHGFAARNTNDTPPVSYADSPLK